MQTENQNATISKIMENNLPIAKRAVIAVDRISKQRSTVDIEIFLPYPVDEGKNYFCHIDFKGINEKVIKVGGVDSLQALALAVHQLKIRFEELQNEKYDFFWLDGETSMDTIDYLPKKAGIDILKNS